MHASILSTKLYFPPARRTMVTRPRLVERLLAGLKAPLTLISAPAGYGKTTLLSEWRIGAGINYPVAWYSIDSGDDNPFRFWSYITAALDTLQEGLTVDAASLLQSPQFPSAEDLIAALLNDISSFPNDFALILDDYHIIASPEIHQFMTYLVDHIPQQMHLVLLTRLDPSLPLARLRARNQLMELRAEDLRFTADEAAEFLNSAMGLRLNSEMVRALEQRTEGWIAGLQMAALTMKGREDINGFIGAFTGNNRYVLDYLAEEVLQQQPETLRTFLLRTSILERLTGPLCDAVTGQKDGERTLAELERRNLFIVPLDDERRWFRYHHLLTDLLLVRLKQEQRSSLNELYLRAASWCEQNGYFEEAIRYAIAAQDYELAARLISQIKDLIWGRGAARTMIEWMKLLPEEFIRSQSKSCMSYAAGLTITGYTEAAEKWLQMVEAHVRSLSVPNERERLMPAEICIYRSVAARFHGNADDAITLSQRGIDLIRGKNPRLEGIGTLFLGQSHFYAGDTECAEQTLIKAIQMNRASGHVAACLNAYHHLAQLRILQARLYEAREIYCQAVEFAARQDQPVCVGVEHAGLGDLNREWSDLAGAASEIQQGVRQAEAGDDVFFFRDAYLIAARLAQSQKDWGTAQAFLYKAEQVVRRDPLSMDIGLIEAWRGHLHMASGNLPAAIYWAQACGLSLDDDLGFQHEFAHLTLARVLLAQGNPAGADRLLNRLLRTAESSGRTGRVIEMLIVQSLVKVSQEEIDPAIVILERALTLAESEGYIRIFLEEGEPVVNLLRRAASKGLHPTYIRHILSAAATADTRGKLPQPLSEPLSERELEILSRVAEGRSNQQIAEELFLAVGTVKRHVSNIFGKMSVQSRTECIARARELNLLE